MIRFETIFKIFFIFLSSCSQLICSETIVNYISGNFVVWAWDMTHDTNRTRFVLQQGTFNLQNSVDEARAVLAHLC